MSQLISVWCSDGILAALVVVSMAAPLESPRFLYQSATPEARTEGGRRLGAAGGVDSNSTRQEWRGGLLRLWLPPVYLFSAFVLFLSATTLQEWGQSMCSSPLPFCWKEGVAGSSFLGPKANLLGSAARPVCFLVYAIGPVWGRPTCDVSLSEDVNVITN